MEERRIETPEAKLDALRAKMAEYAQVVVAFSGGVDSAFLLRVAVEVLGERALAITARSPSMMTVELHEASALAEELGARHEIFDTEELSRAGYVENTSERCYFCKSELFGLTESIARKFGQAVVVDGFNADDIQDHRPGHRAANEHGVMHPLAEVGLRKEEIRSLSRSLGLRTWNKPQLACLASRFPYGMPVTERNLQRIEQVETKFRNLGFRDVRARLVRENEDMLRLEIGEDELARALHSTTRQAILQVAHAQGFRFVTIDMEGFRSGRLNEGLVQMSPRSNHL
jgi:pyridinium-3,5-biscarboxylic acid mononucleotide sulfurtransferase